MAKIGKSALVPRLRFPEFRRVWRRQEIGKFLTENRVAGSDGSIAKKLTVKLWGNGVHEKRETTRGSENTQYYKRKAGQFIYSKLDFLNQAFGVIPQHLDGYESTVDLPCFDMNEEIDPRFLLSYVQRKEFYLRFGEIADGGRKAKRIQAESFLSFPIFLPDKVEEQKKIADCLTSLDELIAAQRRKAEVLKTYKRGLMRQLFPREGENLPGLRFPEFSGAPVWTTRELGSMVSKVGSGVTPLGGDKNYKLRGRPFVRSQNIGWSELLLDDIAYIDEQTHRSFDGTEIQEKDVLLNITGASIGRSAVADSRIVGGNVNQHVCIVRVKADELNPVFLNQFLISERGQKQIDGFQAGGNRQGLNFAQIRSFEVPIPTAGSEQQNVADCLASSEQQKVADCLASLDAEIMAENRKLDALKAHKTGLMQQLFPSLKDVK